MHGMRLESESKAAKLAGMSFMKKSLCVLGILALSSSAFGQGKPKVKEYDFSGDTIDGELVRPDGEAINVDDFAKYDSLIKIRRHFIEEILKTAEDLK